jgi:hypothetical protein
MFASLYCMILAISSRLTSPWITPDADNAGMSAPHAPLSWLQLPHMAVRAEKELPWRQTLSTLAGLPTLTRWL